VECSATGDKFKTDQRTVNLSTVGTGRSSAGGVITSSDGIVQRVFGGGTRRVAIFARAGAGKSWMMAQLKWLFSKARRTGAAAEWVPVFVAVQAIASALHVLFAGLASADLKREAAVALTIDWLVEHVVAPRMAPAITAMLGEAVASERAVFVFDGVDEGGALREVIEDLILAVGRQHRVVVTSRPEGVRRQLYEDGGYLLLSLRPLTTEQQQQMIDKRLTPGSGAQTFFANLMPFSASRRMMDLLFAQHFPDQLILQKRKASGQPGGTIRQRRARQARVRRRADCHRQGGGTGRCDRPAAGDAQGDIGGVRR
jgi:hypothetical protein